MVLLCFLLDLRSLPPPLLRDLEQSLLQLANLYSISSGCGERQSEIPRDRIGLCYVRKNRLSCSDELKIAYSPRGNFNLCDFHNAVYNLPVDAFLPEMSDTRPRRSYDVKLSSLLSNKVLYSWGGKDIVRKVILISTRLVEKNDSSMRRTLMDAADKCVSVEFVLLEHESSQHKDISENIKEFVSSICDLENCLLRTCLPDAWVLCGLVKQWLQELKNDLEESLQSVFLFKTNLIGSVNQILCNLSASVNQIIDGFSPSQVDDQIYCTKRKMLLGNRIKKSYSCPVTCHDLETCDVIENAVKVGGQTILFLPSFQSFPKLQCVTAPISFNVIERTNLGALNEGAIIGTSYIVTPSTWHETETPPNEFDISESNTQFFLGLCRALHSLDQGLVCSSNCNTETMRETTFLCFYILQPSYEGSMLLRRLAGSEEILPIPDAIRSIDSSVPKEIENSIRTSLSNMKLRDYNPLLHERCFHPKLNLLVKESLQLGSIPPKWKEASSEVMALLESTEEALEVEEQIPQPTRESEEDKSGACITEEWEQLIVNEVGQIYSPTCISKPKVGKSVVSPPDSNKLLDEKNSRILERLEIPRQMKAKVSSPVIKADGSGVGMKKPLVPYRPTDQGPTSSQPMKPSFQRLKRKQR
ncbi:hypothetical protein HHK36_015982 [Tetracentron sinense]|uniref:Uncharacterized protein n=1 Tax=Tetracentron sinense TaxID=13715 RepID=A0A834Z683_TETSI|nr:hypothetical protein HHK36_015982 [Tetracentron sinense]